jgi:hypothetical protein
VKFIDKLVAAGVLALTVVFMGIVQADGDPPTAPPTAPNVGCLGQTFHVSIEKHSHTSTKMTVAGGISPTGRQVTKNYDLSIKATYVQELRDGKFRRVSGSVDWFGKKSDDVVGCGFDTCDAGGHLQLGGTDSGWYGLSQDQRDQMKFRCTGKTTGNCFNSAAFAANGGASQESLPYPDIRKMYLEQLRYAHGADEGYYSEVLPDGTRYSEMVEPKGHETLSISADQTDIVPNATCSDASCVAPKRGEATSQLTITATCDGVPLKNRQIGVRIDVMPRSGYHNHLGTRQSPRPRGRLVVGQTPVDCGGSDTDALGSGPRLDSDDIPCITVNTNANGEAKVKFESPLTGSADYAKKKGGGPYLSGIAGSYWITARDLQISAAPVSTMITARVKDLQPATFDTNLVEVRGGTSAHPQGSYGTKGTVEAFSKLAERFNLLQILHNATLTGDRCKKLKAWPVAPASTNDIALHDGGIFDWRTTKTPWRPSHQTHNKGQGGDFNRFGDYQNSTKTDCGGTAVNLQVWYMQVLVELGKDYGRWDCADLGASGADPRDFERNYRLGGNIALFSPTACEAGEIPVGKMIPGPGPWAPPMWQYFPPRLHLHVED